VLNEYKNPVNLSGDAFRTFARAVYLSIDNKDIDTFIQLNSFIYDRLSSSFQNDNIKSFEQFSGHFVWYYDHALDKSRSSTTYKDIYDVCAERSAMGLKEKLGWWFRFYERDKQPSLDERKRINEYSKVLLNRYAQLINICLRKKDLGHLSFILNELQQSSRTFNHELSNLKWEIVFKRREKLKGDQAKELVAMEERYAVDAYVDNTVRLLFKATLFWSFFLYQMNVLSADELRKVIGLFQSYKGYIQYEFVEDLIILRSIMSEHEYAWGGWDYMERLSGVTYTPPTPSYWATLGAVLYSLQSNTPITIETEDSNPDQINAMEYLLSSMLDISKVLQENGYAKWGAIIGAEEESKFKSRLSTEIDRYTRLKNTAITEKEKILADINPDPQIVENFKKIMCDGWENGNDIRTVFKHFDKIVDLVEDNEDQKLFSLGSRNQVWLGYKTSLVKDEQFYIPIYGIERHGESLQDNEENLFFSLFTDESSGEDIKLFQELDKSINDLSKKEFAPSVILCGYDLWRNYFQDLKSADFLFTWNDKQGYPFANFGGVYKGLPIVYFRSVLMNNALIVADFKKAFTLIQKPNDKAYKKIVNIKIDEITEEKAKGFINENPNYWKKNLSEEDAIIKLRNSVLVDFYLIENFIIDNKDAYSVIRLGT
jgi:hypothetical protein